LSADSGALGRISGRRCADSTMGQPTASFVTIRA